MYHYLCVTMQYKKNPTYRKKNVYLMSISIDPKALLTFTMIFKFAAKFSLVR